MALLKTFGNAAERAATGENGKAHDPTAAKWFLAANLIVALYVLLLKLLGSLIITWTLAFF